MAKKTPTITARPTMTASEIREFVDKQKIRTKVLRDRMEDHAEFLRDDWFKMPDPYPENYQSFPTAKPRGFKDKLTSSWLLGLSSALSLTLTKSQE